MRNGAIYLTKRNIVNMKLNSHKKTIILLKIDEYDLDNTFYLDAWNWCKKNKIIKNDKIIEFSRNDKIAIANYVF